MRAGKNHLEEDEDDEFGGKRDVMPSANLSEDGKSNDKANIIRSKHSVTEQRRRSKINERYQILRGLVPDSDQKRDTASFLLEVIHYVQFLQEKVQKYEGSYQTWSSEPTKLVPWRNGHWPVHSFASQSQTMKNPSGPGATFPGRLDENTAMRHSVQQNHIELEAPCGSMDQETELSNNAVGIPLHLQANLHDPIVNDGAFSHVLHGPPPDGPPTECPNSSDALNHQNELTLERGTISISSVYSQRLLNSLTQALHSTGLDLSQATVSVQINLGKQVDRSSISGISPKDHGIPAIHSDQNVGTFQEAGRSEGADQAQKRQKT